MSLRARLAAVLAGVLIGPLAAAAVVVGVVLPRQAEQAGQALAQQQTRASVAVLRDRCAAVATLAQLTASRMVTIPLTEDGVSLAAESVGTDLPGRRLAVVGPDGAVIGASGVDPATLVPGTGALTPELDCRQGSADDGEPALVVSARILEGTSEVARAVAWLPLTTESLDQTLAAVGAVEGDLVSAGLFRTRTADPLVRTTLDLPPDVVARVAEGGQRGVAGDNAYAAENGQAVGVPYTLVVSLHVQSGRGAEFAAGLIVLTLGVAAAMIWVLASRLTAPLERLTAVAARLGAGDYRARTGVAGPDEVGQLGEAFDAMAADLEATVGELRSSRDALAQTFDRFGEALARTHDLGGLLETVLEAAMRGGSCVVGTAFLGDVGGLEERANCVADDASPAMSDALGDLAELAARAVRERRDVVVDAVRGSGPALAVPLQREDRVVGAIALARAPGAPTFEPPALAAVGALAASAGTAVANVRLHDETRRLSVTDPLTGAGNFRHLSTTIAREIERADRFSRPLAILMLDLDHFKDVNDTHGHEFGDAVLREFARRLQTCVREVDTVARYGGEEFTVILPETDAEGAARVAARIVTVVHDSPFRVGGRSRQVTVSVGVAAFPGDGRTGAEVMRAADQALYSAKNDGRDRWALPPGARPARKDEPRTQT